ncbi:NUDIX hydrolase [Rhizobium sp. BK251]|uniref:NUDIX hydrolase n=1 Tax=Rhizobium sp. BK251 TaxID=2512125 RepID=UPI001048CC9C|nr:NUDIX hydrolase [Rhizobium sp. BK251]TCL70446.1 8-oxo-dGTP pyrophosphatase MutT (NUDIX family) [Rhizobium sp. BK251]
MSGTVSTSPRPQVQARPRDAAALILVDRSGSHNRVLLGRRAAGHVFMPDLYVFPGGRRDPRDHALAFSRDLHASVAGKLAASSRAGINVRALALAAVRELEEETSLVLGGQGCKGGNAGNAADLSCLRFIARAITPPGHVRRYDTRFFLAFTDEAGVDPSDIRDSEELTDLRWLDIADVSCLNIPDITRIILNDVVGLLEVDPSLRFDVPVPFYVVRNGRFVRNVL